MKKDIHPKYEKTTIECACGNTLETKSTAGNVIKVELCSACHPFFTGKQKFVDTAGRVDKFRARMEKAASIKSKEQAPAPKTEDEKKDNKEVLEEIKENLNNKTQDNPIQVTQEQSSDVEIAAADELADEMGEHQEETEENEKDTE